MSAGTLTLTNKSAAVSGSGTAFTTELAAGDFVVVTVGGIPYTLPVKIVNSNTSLTLVSNFTGPTQSGAAWYAVPRIAMNLVTAELVAQSAEALRGLNYDKQNWQQVFSGTGTITVRLPDGTSFPGLAWNSIVSLVDKKADKTALDDYAKKGTNNDITSLNGLTTSLSVSQGGTGGKNPADAANNIGVGPASYPFFSGATISTTGYAILGVQNTSRGAADVGARVSIEASVAANARGSIIQRNNQDNQTGQIRSELPATSGVLAIQGTSGREYKKDIKDADTSEAMQRIMSLRMVNFVYKNDDLARVRFGIIAEEAEEPAPQYVKHNQFPVDGSQIYDEDGHLVSEKYVDRPSIDNNPIVMDLLGCIQNLQAQITELKSSIGN
ncbi:tail fiber domain-containing protein [Citrobacter sp. Cpo035]|uniref:tail fiber domain-containing protein n=1 Tax=Citrobacter sp. Cpo035 TaxID=2985124 RepID=UPI0025761B3E|nr:tail fiber domain-containing protein [Citrobacter sp. Cpo035]MDM2917733.1 tail fiber domain-containing protein [Citrobacter sp. Cpo035]